MAFHAKYSVYNFVIKNADFQYAVAFLINLLEVKCKFKKRQIFHKMKVKIWIKKFVPPNKVYQILSIYWSI